MRAVESRAGPAEIRALLAEGAYVDAIDGQANWPLYMAANLGHAEAVRQLLDGRADVNKATTDTGCTPLYVAAHCGHAEVVRQLLDGRADVNKASTDDGSTPLLMAADRGHAEVMRQLLDGGRT
jgi:ankyrin repeat protein